MSVIVVNLSSVMHLRYDEAGKGEAGNEVALELGEGVLAAPFEHREDVLQGEPQLPGPRLVLVPPHRLVGEERLLHRAGELRQEVLLRRRADIVAVVLLLRGAVVHVASRLSAPSGTARGIAGVGCRIRRLNRRAELKIPDVYLPRYSRQSRVETSLHQYDEWRHDDLHGLRLVLRPNGKRFY